MSTDTSTTDPCREAEVDQLRWLVEQYTATRAALVSHDDFETSCVPDRLYHDRDDAAVEVAEAAARLLQGRPLGKQNGSEHA